MALSDQSRQAHRASVTQRHAPAAAVDAEHRIARGHPQVAPQGQLEAPCDGMALDRRQDRLREQHPRRPHRAVAVRFDAIASAFANGLQVGSGAEGATRAGEDRDRLTTIRVEGAERVGEGRGGGTVDRVADLGPGDGDDRHRPVDL